MNTAVQKELNDILGFKPTEITTSTKLAKEISGDLGIGSAGSLTNLPQWKEPFDKADDAWRAMEQYSTKLPTGE